MDRPDSTSALLDPPVRATAAPARAAAPARWEASAVVPAGWEAALAACGGSFFHSPHALEVSLPAGTPVYARLARGGETLAVALGVAASCRFSRRARHLRFATLPAAAPGVDRDGAAASLASFLAADGAAEVAMDSFDACAEAAPVAGSLPARPRREYVVPLDGGPDELLSRLARSHRRNARRGEDGGWQLRTLRGDEAATVLRAVQETASGRARQRGDGFPVGEPPAAVGRAASPERAWGLSTFAAFDGGAPLAAALVGWANGRVYYLMGGSTADGYRRNAAAWLHWRVMSLFAAHGCRAYNLGGVPADAAREGHPSYGLHRFKEDFGAEIVACRGLRCETAPRHLWLHRAAARLAGGGR